MICTKEGCFIFVRAKQLEIGKIYCIAWSRFYGIMQPDWELIKINPLNSTLKNIRTKKETVAKNTDIWMRVKMVKK